MEETSTTKKENKLKDKKTLGIIGVFIILGILVAGGFFIFTNRNSQVAEDDPMASSDLPELSPSDIGMEVTLRSDNKAVMFELTKADDIKHVEYIIEYEAEVEGETTNQGIFGEMKIAEDGITKTDYREFGTCSAGRCRYDNVVSDATITLKVTKKDGKEYQVIKVVKLPSSSE